MSITLAGIKIVPSETPAEELRREITDRAQRAYERSLRLRRLIIVVSLTFSMGQCAYSIALPAGSELPWRGAVTWGVPLLASLFAMSLEWSCRLHRDQCQQQYATYLCDTGRRAAVFANRLPRAA